MPTYQVMLSSYTHGRPDDDDLEMFLVEEPDTEPSPVEKAVDLLLDLRSEIEDVAASSDGMPSTDLPHNTHPPNLLPRQERGYRLINQWNSELVTDSRVDRVGLDRTYEAEKSGEYHQWFTVEIITLHIEIGPVTIELEPDGVDKLIADEEKLWSGNLFHPDPLIPHREELTDLVE